MRGLPALIAWAVIALAPLTAEASPSPSPTLDKVLAPAPSADFVEADGTDPTVDEGPVDAARYAAGYVHAAQAQRLLESDGFVTGYGRTWVSLPASQVLVEDVIAFSGGGGAKTWLASSEHGDKADSNYDHPNPVAGIDSAYGAHFHFTSTASTDLPYGDTFAFVKGNDFFVVFVSSTKDDGTAFATTQLHKQFDLAPPYTIPPSQLPQAAPNTNNGIGQILVLGALAAAGLFAAIFLASRRQRRVVRQIPAIDATFVLSQDGRYWWDGDEWKDTAQWVPPNVQRSADGTMWWDGSRWRPLPPLPKLF